MNKRTLKKQAKKAEQTILKDSSDFFDEFIEKNYEKKDRKNRISKIIAFAGTAFAAVLTLVLCLVFLLPDEITPIEPPEPKYYLLKNEKIEIIDIADFESEDIVFHLIDGYNYTLRHAYDIEYGDILYYWIDLTNEDSFESISIYFYVNPDYENKKFLDKETGTKTISNLPINYYNNTVDDDGIFIIQYKSVTDLGEIMIYIEYEQWSFEEESNFFNFFEQSIEKA